MDVVVQNDVRRVSRHPDFSVIDFKRDGDQGESQHYLAAHLDEVQQ